MGFLPARAAAARRAAGAFARRGGASASGGWGADGGPREGGSPGRAPALSRRAPAFPRRLANGLEGVRIESKGRLSTLTFFNVSEKDYGNYTCVATNKLGNTNASIILYGRCPFLLQQGLVRRRSRSKRKSMRRRRRRRRIKGGRRRQRQGERPAERRRGARRDKGGGLFVEEDEERRRAERRGCVGRRERPCPEGAYEKGGGRWRAWRSWAHGCLGAGGGGAHRRPRRRRPRRRRGSRQSLARRWSAGPRRGPGQVSVRFGRPARRSSGCRTSRGRSGAAGRGVIASRPLYTPLACPNGDGLIYCKRDWTDRGELGIARNVNLAAPSLPLW